MNSLVASSPDGLSVSLSTNPLAASGFPFNAVGSSSQPRLIQARQNEKGKLDGKFKWVEEFLGNSGFESIGDFLKILFYNPTCVDGQDNPRGVTGLAVAQFLQGKTKAKMSEMIGLIYSHKHSAPLPRISPAAVNHAHPSLFTWATNLVGNHVHLGNSALLDFVRSKSFVRLLAVYSYLALQFRYKLGLLARLF